LIPEIGRGWRPLRWWLSLVVVLSCLGCGTTRDKLATEQLLLSDAVDRAVAHIDFSALQGEKVYLDTQYIKQLKSNPNSFVNADYIISSLRQQMVYAGCLLQENQETADYIAEARVGALGTDGHDVNYGIPPSQTLNAAASIVSGGFALPTLPEISLARRQDDTAAAKIAVFAYRRDTKQPAWQSGLSIARSRSKERWILGAGPFQSGSGYKGMRFAGERLTDERGKWKTTVLGVEEIRRLPEYAYEDYRGPDVLDEQLKGNLDRDLGLAPEHSAETVASRPEPAAPPAEPVTPAASPSEPPAPSATTPPPPAAQ
jgi:hypothetical protein